MGGGTARCPLLVWGPSGHVLSPFPGSAPAVGTPPLYSDNISQENTTHCVIIVIFTCFPLRLNPGFIEERIHILLEFVCLISITLPEHVFKRGLKSEFPLSMTLAHAAATLGTCSCGFTSSRPPETRSKARTTLDAQVWEKEPLALSHRRISQALAAR